MNYQQTRRRTFLRESAYGLGTAAFGALAARNC